MKVYYKAFLFLQQPLLGAVQRVCTENYQLSFLRTVNKKIVEVKKKLFFLLKI